MKQLLLYTVCTWGTSWQSNTTNAIIGRVVKNTPKAAQVKKERMYNSNPELRIQKKNGTNFNVHYNCESHLPNRTNQVHFQKCLFQFHFLDSGGEGGGEKEEGEKKETEDKAFLYKEQRR